MQAVGTDLIAELLEALGLAAYADDPVWRALLVFSLFLLLGAIADIALRVMARVVAQRTTTTADDILLRHLRQPIVVSLVLVGAWLAIVTLQTPPTSQRIAGSLLATSGILLWTRQLMQLSRSVLEHFSSRGRRHRLVERRTIPLFDMLFKVLVVGGCGYGLMLAWHIDVTAWLASAGVLGIAIGFAAQETLSNMLAGVMIIADAPYKLGDYLVLDGTVRGRVTDIGLRSTRLLTEHNVEIIVPNAEMVRATITNESGGGTERSRVVVPAGVAYGSQIERVRAVLLDVAGQTEGVIVGEPGYEPTVRFKAMGASSLDFDVLVWIARPEHRLDVIDRMNTNIYTRLQDEGIEIPFPKRDVYLYDMGKPEA